MSDRISNMGNAKSQTSLSGDFEVNTCGICYQTFNEKSRLPKILVCGHTYCKCCIKSLNSDGSLRTACPVCRRVTREAPHRIPTNYQLLQVLQRLNLMSTNDGSDTEGDPEDTEPSFNSNDVDNNDHFCTIINSIEREIDHLKLSVTSVGLSYPYCFPNTDFYSFESDIVPDPNTISALKEITASLEMRFSEVHQLLGKARVQRDNVLGLISAGIGKVTPDGKLEIQRSLPNGNSLSEEDVRRLNEWEEMSRQRGLHGGIAADLFDSEAEEDDEEDDYYASSYGYDIDNYLDDETHADDDHLVDNLFDNYVYGNYGSDVMGYNHHEWNTSDNHLNLNNTFDVLSSTSGGGYCDVCNCRLPLGVRSREIHNAGRRHARNIRLRNETFDQSSGSHESQLNWTPSHVLPSDRNSNSGFDRIGFVSTGNDNGASQNAPNNTGPRSSYGRQRWIGEGRSTGNDNSQGAANNTGTRRPRWRGRGGGGRGRGRGIPNLDIWMPSSSDIGW